MSYTATNKQEKAEVKFLMEEANNHKNKHQDQLKAYEEAEKYLPTLKAMQKWFEETLEFLKKNGKAS